MSEALLKELETVIDDRQDELLAVQFALENYARKDSRTARFLKLAVIVLGAVVVTRDVADKLFPASVFPKLNKSVIVLYTLVGLSIAVIGGVAAAFKFESRAAGINVL